MRAPLATFGMLSLVGACAGPDPGRDKGPLVPIPGLTVADVTTAARPRRIALLIGVNDFDDPFWPDLRYAAKDADDLAQVLSDPKGGGFDEVIALTSVEDTSWARVSAELDRLGSRAPRPEDVVLVYISSHGTLALAPKGAPERVLILRDTRHADLRRTGVFVTALEQRFEALASQRKILILATCHSGGGKSLLLPEVAEYLSGLKGGLPAIEEVSRASIVLSASELGQPAREDDRLEHDVYTHFFLEALRERADADGDGAVSATEAHDYARRRTFEFTAGLQVPTVRSTIVGADPIFLAGRAERLALPVLYSYAPGLEGVEVRAGGRSKGVFPGTIVLDPGEQAIELLRPGEPALYHGAIAFDRGARVSAEVLIEEASPSWSIGARAGAFAILGAGTADGLPTTMFLVGARFTSRDPWAEGWDLLFDFDWSTSEKTVRPDAFDVPQSMQAVRVGGAYAHRSSLGPLELRLGPQLSYLVLLRGVQLPGLREKQAFGTLLPGAVGSLSLGIGAFVVTLESQLHYLPLVLDGEVRSLATASLSAGIGAQF